jgi:phosphatidylserine/phosphatidylglycerophosphate/cardiolipin synthase-like enzyme
LINAKPKPGWGPMSALAVATGLVVTLMAIPSSYAADPEPGVQPEDLTSAVPLAKASDRQDRPRKRYTPTTGVRFNHPLRPKLKRRINTHVLKTIQAVPKGAKIRALSWNVRSAPYRRALINAHRRGVSVRILMSRAVASRQAPNQDYGILRRELRKGNKKRPKAMKSWMRSCKASCRGPSGIAHAKWYIFSDAGKADWVVMSGSANLTEVAANNQWNDLYTVVGNRRLYGHFNHVFRQAAKDRPAKPAFLEFPMRNRSSAWFLPYRGRGADGDPVMKVLRPVKCAGANHHSGIRGHTAIRIAQTAILDERGQEIAKRLKYLHNHGCNIRLVYTVLGPDVGKILRRDGGHGPVPMRQIAQDFDDDGSFDRYLHMKAMSISGHYGRSTSTHLVYNGSQNWTAVSFASDEAGFTINSDGLERKYGNWVNVLFENPPPNPNPRSALGVPWSVRYSEVELD